MLFPQGLTFCPNCGKEVPLEATFWPTCDFNLQTRQATPAPVPYAPQRVPKKSSFRKTVLVVILVVIVLAVIAGSLGGMQHPTRKGSVTVKVDYTGSWSGGYLDGSNYVSWDGTGTRTATLTNPPAVSLWVIVVSAQKQDGSSETLTVSILLPNGTVLNSANTSAAYGGAQTFYSLKD